MSGGGGSKTTTTVQSADPWSGQQPYLAAGFEKAMEGFNTPAQYYPGQTFIPRNEYEYMADMGMFNYAGAGMPGQISDAMLAQQQMLFAPDLANNPYVGDYARQMNERVATDFTRNVMPGIGHSAMAAGQYGGSRQGIAEGIAMGDLGRTMTEQTAGLYNQAYGLGLEQQARGMAFAPQTMGMGLTPFQTMSDVGGRFRGDLQQYLDEDMARWQFAQTERDQALERYMSMVRGDYGGTTTSTGPDPNATSPVANMAGGAMAGYGIGTMMSSSAMAGPYGAAAGALLSLLMS